jgi:hypothetical protein
VKAGPSILTTQRNNGRNEEERPVGTNVVLLVGRGVLVAASMALWPVPVGAANDGTRCTFEFVAIAAPGISTAPTSGTIATDGETGTFTCTGPVGGHQVTGPGTLGLRGRYGITGGDTCQWGGEGDGVDSLTVPTSGGDQRISNTVTSMAYGTLHGPGPLSGTFDGDRMSGTFEFRPLDGDCVSEPVTRFRVTGQGILR